MKIYNLFLSLLMFSTLVWGQSETSFRLLGDDERAQIFGVETQIALGINYGIFEVYQYHDLAGEHYLVLTEGNELHPQRSQGWPSIEGFSFLKKGEGFSLEWKMKDFILPEPSELTEETHIRFWSEYLKLADWDGDGYIEPVIPYGTIATNGYDDGRIKILLYERGKKRAIRHQNGVLDGERYTQVDLSFYALPSVIQDSVKGIMEKIMTKNQGIFPYGWEEAMKRKELTIDEN